MSERVQGGGAHVLDTGTDRWHLWTRAGGRTDCGLDVANQWTVTRQAPPAPGRYCPECFTSDPRENDR